MGFAIICPRPVLYASDPVPVHRFARCSTFLFSLSATGAPLRFAITSLPSVCEKDTFELSNMLGIYHRVRAIRPDLIGEETKTHPECRFLLRPWALGTGTQSSID